MGNAKRDIARTLAWFAELCAKCGGGFLKLARKMQNGNSPHHQSQNQNMRDRNAQNDRNHNWSR